jgi:tetratricopeptide (TPR) repeat protein
MAIRRVLFLCLILFSSCAPKEKITGAAPVSELEKKLAQGNLLRQKACYVALKQAFGVYSDLYARPPFKKKAAFPLATTALLLAVREKELGLANRTYLDRALAIIKENSALTALAPYAEIAGVYSVQGKGVMRDIDERFSWVETSEKIKKMDLVLREKAKTDEFSAYMYASLSCAFSSSLYNLNEKKDNLAEIWNSFPDSLLLKYKRAVCPEENEERLKEIIALEPRFYEAEYFLGNLALRQGNLLEAEGRFLKAYGGIPESPQVTVTLASIYYATEELDRSLEFYEKTLALAPEYRDALLGKAICLSYLGKPKDAIDVLQKIISLGYWLLGESYYWLAWNQHELKNIGEAAVDIEQAKTRLPTSTEVFTLSGILAFETGDLVKAEKEFKEALQYNPSNIEALFNLGGLYVQKSDWNNSGVYFEKAALAFENEARSLREKMDQIEKSSLPAERKEKLIQKKKNQVERTSFSRATAFYDGAAGYFNAGEKSKALELAKRALEHPSFKQKAEELIAQIKS